MRLQRVANDYDESKDTHDLHEIDAAAQGREHAEGRTLRTDFTGFKERAVDGVDDGVAYQADDCPDSSAYNEVAGIVDAEIDARVAVDQCPEDNEQSEATLSEHDGGKSGEAERVGGMTGGKTVRAAAVAVDNVGEF